jgi:GH25 family lysozyme M1 (1,4-beta-N-acetylmuramidase)
MSLHKIKVFAIAITALILAGCSSSASKPNETDARKFFEQQADFISGNARVKDFKKINGVDLSDREYRLDWEAEVEYLRDIRNLVGLAYRKGEVRKIRGSYTFELTEKGWDFKRQ